jgi:hypothetical protein
VGDAIVTVHMTEVDPNGGNLIGGLFTTCSVDMIASKEVLYSIYRCASPVFAEVDVQPSHG